MSSKKLKILLVGGGGRENAIARALAASPRTEALYAAPGNPGIARYAQCVPTAAGDIAGLVDAAVGNRVDLVVVGPEQPLVDGLADALAQRRIPVAGPVQAAARLEGSKVFAKSVMTRLGIPQAEPYQVFDRFEDAKGYLSSLDDAPVVVKADGLAAGKGVVVAQSRREALDAAQAMLVEKRFGPAGRQVIVEPYLEGVEASLLFVCDGRHAVPLASARDYKRLLAGDRGPNTGGMGAHSPGHRIDAELVARVQRTIVEPLLAGVAEMGILYRGVLYCGLMLTAAGPKVLEFNCRFGDPEAQVILPRLRSCLVSLLQDAAVGSLAGVEIEWDQRAALCAVLASEGYPGTPRCGRPIHGLDVLGDDIIVDQAGTAMENGRLITVGGRVMAIGALGDTLDQARSKAYDAVSRIHFEGMQYRQDIGAVVGDRR